MSVLINGFRIPTENDPKTFLLHFHDDGTAEMVALGYPQIRYGVVVVPTPHGRLIDADALRAKMYHDAFETDSPLQKWDGGCWIRYKMFEDNEENAPTVIPASEEKT